MNTTTKNILKNYVGGKWIEPQTTRYQAVPNPATDDLLAEVPLSVALDVDEAVEAAKEAFKTWSTTPVPKRARILFKFQQLLVDHWDELAKMITEENGKSY
ncbi:MAG: aldehyde dehydrogenase family protein, partial [Bacillus sp. (in: Bacteria)]|nr:aldehyde dehydrogenase family protein [Bacillus sp. (in: firmicutes)]